MPVALNLPSFNIGGFKDTLADWKEIITKTRGDGDVLQIVQEKKLGSAFVLELFIGQNISYQQAVAICKQQFRGSSSGEDQETVLSNLVEIIVNQLRRLPPKIVADPLVGRPWFGINHGDEDHLASVLKDKEELAEFVVVAFFLNSDTRIRNMAPIYLRPFLMFIYNTYKSSSVLNSIWRFLNQFEDLPTRQLMRDIVVLASDHSIQIDLLTICLESPNVELQQKEVSDYLLMLVVGLQNEQRVSKLRRSLNVIIESIWKVTYNSTQLEVILLALGRCLDTLHISLIPTLVNLLMIIMRKSTFSSLTLNTILDSVIQWFSRPCPFITSETYKSFETILQIAQNPRNEALQLHDLNNWNDLMLHDRRVTSIVHLTKLHIALQIDSTALSRLISNWNRIVPEDFNSDDIRLIRALILSPLYMSHLDDILTHLRRIMRFTKIPRPMPITPFLFKLARETDAKSQLLLLKLLPEFATNYSNIPIILSTLRNFDKIPCLDLVCLELYYQMSLKEYRASSRVIEHLEYLQTKRNKSLEMSLAMIVIVRRMCQQKKGGQNCREMVKFISHIINEDCANNNDGIVMVVALDAIQILCENQTINVPSTWAAIKSNFKDEQRKNVRIKLYSFFSIIPKLVKLETIADEALPDEILGILWRDLMQETDGEIIKHIFTALKAFPYDSMRFIRFPALFREKVKLPRSHLSDVTEAEYTESFPYIPGECWLEMLEKVPQQSLNHIHIFIAHFIDLELQSLRGLNQELAEGRQEPKTLTGVQPKSILKAMLNYLVAEIRNDFPETEHVRTAIVKCLSVGFSKPLPHLDWSFLQQVYDQTLELRDDCLRIVCRQVEVSLSARKFVDKYLLNLELKTCGLQQVLVLIENFHRIAKNLKINDAEILLRNCLESSTALGSTSTSNALESMLRLLNVQELNVDLKRIVEETVMQEHSRMSEEERHSKKWIALIEKLGSGFVKELTQPLTEELRIKKQVDDLLKCPEEETSAEKIILMQLVASRLKLAKDNDELEFYGNLLKRLVVQLSRLNAMDVMPNDGRIEPNVWGRYLQSMDEQASVKEGLNQVFTCLMTRLCNEHSSVSFNLKMGLTGISDSHCYQRK